MEKIKASELMLNDWLFDGHDYVQVTMLSKLGGDLVKVIAPFMSYDIAYAENVVALANGAKPLKLLKPVPLDKDIVENFGFTLIEDNMYVIKDGNRKMVVDYIHGFIYTYENNVVAAYKIPEYVHKFQHIIYMCGYNDLVYSPVILETNEI